MQKANFKSCSSSQKMEQARNVQASSTTYTERFYTLLRLIKVSAMIKNATIISSPVIPEKMV